MFIKCLISFCLHILVYENNKYAFKSQTSEFPIVRLSLEGWLYINLILYEYYRNGVCQCCKRKVYQRLIVQEKPPCLKWNKLSVLSWYQTILENKWIKNAKTLFKTKTVDGHSSFESLASLESAILRMMSAMYVAATDNV